jgi:hypothetical protein
MRVLRASSLDEYAFWYLRREARKRNSDLTPRIGRPWLADPKLMPANGNAIPPAPLLSGPPAFTLISLLVAFAVYLRQVSDRAIELWTKIKAGEEKIYPCGEDHTNQKLAALENTHENLDIAAPFLISLVVLVTVRITIDATQRFPSPPQFNPAKTLPMLDLLIVVWISSLFLILGSVHYFARRKGEQVRASTNTFFASPSQSATPQPQSKPRSTALSLWVPFVFLTLLGWSGGSRDA